MRYAPFVLIIAIVLVGCHPIGKSHPFLIGPQCLDKLRGTSVMTKDGKLRFSLYSLTRDSTPSEYPTVIDVEPNRIDLQFLQCGSKLLRGTVRVSSVGIMIDGGPYYSGRGFGIAPKGHKFRISVGDARPEALEMMRDMQLGAGTWLLEGTQYGLTRYRQIAGVRDGKPYVGTTYLGLNFFGRSRSGSVTNINCGSPGPSKLLACEMFSEIRRGVLLTVRLPTENFALWQDYLEAAESYFDTHIEKEHAPPS